MKPVKDGTEDTSKPTAKDGRGDTRTGNGGGEGDPTPTTSSGPGKP